MYKDDEAISAIKAHAEGVIKKHVFNVKVLMNKGVGVAEHPDIIETIQKELDIIAENHDRLEMLDKYF
tara:strand:- start:131 stop:334 length:204 start_codon:yes stop_codon:yes gene_type:complete